MRRFAIRLLGAAGVALALAILAVLTMFAAPSAQAQTFKSLYSFTGSPDGATPYGGVIIKDKSGTLYGTTTYGGASSAGTVYQLSKSGREAVIYSFTGGTDGAEPFAGVVMDKSGNLYGTTIAGGASGFGTVFEVNPKTKKETVLYNFGGSTDGAYPFSGVVMDKSGNLYGTTEAGGSSGDGTVYKVNIKTKKETVLHNFAGGTDGATPLYGNLLMDESGNLYGTTDGGGSSSAGTVWKVSAKGKEAVLYSFTGGSDGGGLFEQSLATDGKGNLYGTTEEGGSDGVGVVFEVNIKTKKETVLYSFSTSGGDGEFPSSGLVRDSKGNLYGTTQIGGANSLGTVFEVKGTKETILHSFDGTDGENPFTSPLLDEKGTLYGTTYNGGTDGHGTVFSVKP
jgi:uncharacterized repeat protein (TIGR03803 family)